MAVNSRGWKWSGTDGLWRGYTALDLATISGLINLVTLLVGDQLTGDVLHTPGKGFALAVGMIVVMAIALAGYAVLQRRAERWRKA